MQRIPRDQSKKFAFNWQDEPLLRVEEGESFEVETWDASTGYFQTPEDLAIPARRPGFDRVPPLANPIGGPVYLTGAERGDTLVVTIEDIEVADFSWTANGPKRGPLGDSNRWPEISTEYTTYILRHEVGPSGTTRDGTIHFNDRISWPITPFVGTIGVAPDREVATSGDGQDAWGGNLDIRDVAPGNKVHLPVYHDGALFYLGDVHASQGDTEFTGTAAETNSTVRVKLELIKQEAAALDAHRKAGLDRFGLRLPAARGGGRDGDVQLDGLADYRVRLHAQRRLCTGGNLSRLPDQRLPDGQAGEAELRGGGGDFEAVLVSVRAGGSAARDLVAGAKSPTGRLLSLLIYVQSGLVRVCHLFA